VDVAQAGPGDTVMVIDEGNGARQILGLDPGAVRAMIVGVVDEVTVGGGGADESTVAKRFQEAAKRHHYLRLCLFSYNPECDQKGNRSQ